MAEQPTPDLHVYCIVCKVHLWIHILRKSAIFTWDVGGGSTAKSWVLGVKTVIWWLRVESWKLRIVSSKLRVNIDWWEHKIEFEIESLNVKVDSLKMKAESLKWRILTWVFKIESWEWKNWELRVDGFFRIIWNPLGNFGVCDTWRQNRPI
jgi:hypothetical protein